MCDLPVKRGVDHVEDVTKADRGRHGGGGISIIVKLQVNRPLRDGIVRDAHPRDRRVRRGLAELVCGHHGRLSRTDPSEGSKGWRGEVKVKVHAGGLSVQEGVDLELGRRAGPWRGGLPWPKAPAKGSSSSLARWGGKEWAGRHPAVPRWSTGTGWGVPKGIIEMHTLRCGRSEIRR